MEHKYYKEYNENVYKKTLENGLEVVLVPKKDYYKTFIVFATEYGAMDLSFVPIGKKNKITQPAGIAHFLEHTLFKMPDGSDAFEKLDSLGVNSNAFTSFDKTAYLISGTENIKEGLNYLLDFVQTPYFTDNIVKNEQGIITEEINMYLDDSNSRLYNKLLENTYKNKYLKEEILGSVESINKITKNDLYIAYNTFYHPANMRLIITGNFDEKEFINIISDNQAKKNFPKAEEIKRHIPYEPKKVFIKESVEELNVSAPIVGISVKFNDNLSLIEQYIDAIKLGMLLDYYFSNSGEIYEKLIKEELINSSFSYYLNLYKESLSFQITSNTKKPEELIAFLRKTLVNLKRRKTSSNRFEMIKRSTYGSFIRNLNRVESINYSYLEIIPYQIDLFSVPKIIKEITKDDVFSLTKQITSDKITTHTIYPKKFK